MGRGPATFSMQVSGLGSETDRRPVEMIHADADKAFKFLDTENVGSIDNEKLRNYLKERDYDAELVDKIFAGIGAKKEGVIDADELRSAFVKFPTLCKAIEVKPRSVWVAMDDGAAEEEIFAVADQVFTMVDTDKSGDIQVSELKALLLADDWEDALVEKASPGSTLTTAARSIATSCGPPLSSTPRSARRWASRSRPSAPLAS